MAKNLWFFTANKIFLKFEISAGLGHFIFPIPGGVKVGITYDLPN